MHSDSSFSSLIIDVIKRFILLIRFLIFIT